MTYARKIHIYHLVEKASSDSVSRNNSQELYFSWLFPLYRHYTKFRFKKLGNSKFAGCVVLLFKPSKQSEIH